MKILTAVLLILAGVLSCSAQENAVIPYDRLYELFQKAAAVQNRDVRATVECTPKNLAVKPGDVTFTIQAKGGARRLRVDADGELHGFPLRSDLYKENPPVLTNQPKGSLKITGSLAPRLPLRTRYSYRKLNAALDAGTAEIKKQAGLLSFVARPARSMTFEFFGGHGQTLTVRAKAAPTTLKADARGEIVFTADKALLAENPPVVLSEKPSKIMLDF